jgi:TolB-like protein
LPASIFLSYASEDREAARSIGDSLAKLGIEVWMDESELGGGDAWDQKIRKQIRECDYFMPIVSARTEARHEGYFRREWRLAVERTLDMADDHLFLLPVVIDDTDQARARVPEKFLAVQWLRAPEGRPTPALEALCRRILNGDPAPVESAKNKPARRDPGAVPKRPLAAPYPPFPREEPGQRVRFWAHVLGWLGQSAWAALQRLPRWLRILIYVWVVIVVTSRGCTPGSHEPEISHSDAKKLKAIADEYRGSAHPADIAKLGAQIASEFSDNAAGTAGHHAVLAIPFGAPEGDPAAGKLADAAFAQTFGRLSVTHRGEVGLDKDSLSSNDLSEALSRARAGHSAYVVYGSLGSQGSAQILSVTVAKADDGSVVWTQSYPAATADATKIAQEIDSKIPAATESKTPAATDDDD